MSALVLMLGACKPTIDAKSQVGLKGNWVLSKVSYPGSEYIKVNSFQIADSKCFEGSSWSFISNNNKGNMSLNGGGDCPSFSSPIVWSITPDQQFGLKIVEAGVKAKRVTSGYFLKLANRTESSFQLIDKVDVGGKQTDVVYQFNKVN